MATSQIKRLHQATGRPVVVMSPAGRIQWHEVFENNPRVTKRPTRFAQRLINAGGCRPYIASKTATHWNWKRWNVAPGEIFLTSHEKDFAEHHAGYVLIEPNTKIDGSNKAWIWERWQELVDRGGRFLQVGPAGTRVLRGVCFVETHNFRLACAVLAESRAFVGTEGGLHHAAAALGIPAVVLFSGFISPEITGYPMHRNIYKGKSGTGCGSRLACDCCRVAMEEISVDEVAHNLEQIL